MPHFENESTRAGSLMLNSSQLRSCLCTGGVASIPLCVDNIHVSDKGRREK